MIHQVAIIIAEDFQARGYNDVSVYADAYVAFSGRANAPIIDSTTDLANVGRSILAKPWKLPEPEEYASSAIAVGIRESDRDAE